MGNEEASTRAIEARRFEMLRWSALAFGRGAPNLVHPARARTARARIREEIALELCVRREAKRVGGSDAAWAAARGYLMPVGDSLEERTARSMQAIFALAALEAAT